nr:hypothetical protein [uncultured Cellulosilyticum sp.]
MTSLVINWSSLIISGHKTFDQVPHQLKQKVATVLIEKGYTHLVIDDTYIKTNTVD